jgi:type 1 glutamine amidotransferase
MERLSDEEKKLIKAGAEEIADEVVCAFSKLYPHIRMSYIECGSLHEMISREVKGNYGYANIHAADLLKDELER